MQIAKLVRKDFISNKSIAVYIDKNKINVAIAWLNVKNNII